MRRNSVLGSEWPLQAGKSVLSPHPDLWERDLFRIKCLIPGDLLTGVAGDAASPHHGGIAHAGAVVDLAVADTGVHLVMLYLIHVWLRPSKRQMPSG